MIHLILFIPSLMILSYWFQVAAAVLSYTVTIL